MSECKFEVIVIAFALFLSFSFFISSVYNAGYNEGFEDGFWEGIKYNIQFQEEISIWNRSLSTEQFQGSEWEENN